MHPPEIRQSIIEVTRAIESLNQVFEKRAADLRHAGDVEGLKQWTNACLAMLDSGKIYISWARHYARLAESPGSSEEENDLSDEGAVWNDTPSGP